MDPSPARASNRRPVVFRDGLGRRCRADDATGTQKLELLCVNNDLASEEFENALRDRVDRLAGFRDPAFANVRNVARFRDAQATLALVSDETSGIRLSEILANTERHEIGIESAAVWSVVRQLTSAVALFHETAPDVAHSAIAPERIILTPEGHVVLVEHVLGGALATLGYSREQFWSTLRVASPPSSEGPTLDHRADVSQIGIVALSLLLGRPLKEHEFPAQIGELFRGVQALLADGTREALPLGLQGWLKRALQLDWRNAFGSAIEASVDLDMMMEEAGFESSGVAVESFLAVYHEHVSGVKRAVSAERPEPVPAAIETAAAEPAPQAEFASEADSEPSDAATFDRAASMDAPPAPSTFLAEIETSGGHAFVTALETSAPAPVSEASVEAVSEPSPEWAAETDVPLEPATPVATFPSPISFDAYPEPAATIGAYPDPAPYPEPKSFSDYPQPSPAFAEEAVGEAPVAAVEDSAPQSALEGDVAAVETETADEVAAVAAAIQFEAEVEAERAPSDKTTATTTTTAPAAPSVATRFAFADEKKSTSSNWPKLAAAAVVLLAIGAGGWFATSRYFEVRAERAEEASPPAPPAASAAAPSIDTAAAPGTAATNATPEAAAPAPVPAASAKEPTPTAPAAPAPAPVPAAAAPAVTAASGAGWIVLSSPVDVQLFEGGRLLGNKQTGRIALTVGKHQIEVVNESLGYRHSRTVDVKSGESATIKVELPKGTIALNALPWAEVFIDGQSVGETPIGNLPVSLGAHEVVFRHPELGEQRLTTTVTLTTPARLSVDMRKK
jgi:serine/threonine protein kinase